MANLLEVGTNKSELAHQMAVGGAPSPPGSQVS